MKTLVLDLERTVVEKKRVAVLVPDSFPDPQSAPLPWQCVAAQVQTLETDLTTDWAPQARQPARSDWVLVCAGDPANSNIPPAAFRLRGGTVKRA